MAICGTVGGRETNRGEKGDLKLFPFFKANKESACKLSTAEYMHCMSFHTNGVWKSVAVAVQCCNS